MTDRTSLAKTKPAPAALHPLTKLTMAQAKKGLAAREFSALELMDAHIQSAEALKSLNFMLQESYAQAQAGAKAADAAYKAGKASLLEGLPIGLKDLFCTEGVKTTAGSKILGTFTPPYESTVSANLKSAGALSIGKLNMDEFAMGSANITSAFGPVTNPWRRSDGKALVPGGSSGGSVAAVAAHAVLGATASDTGGSIRQPAAFTGLVGILPTYGRCSRYGMVAFASSLDQAGPVTRTVEDAAMMLQAMAGYDPKDSTSINTPVPDYTAEVGQSIKGLRVGIPAEYRPDGLSAELQALWDQGIAWLKDAGATIVDISLPHTHHALPTYYIIAPAEASSNLARYDGVRYGYRTDRAQVLDDLYELSRAEGFGREVKRRIMIGTYVLSSGYYDAYYLKAQRVRSLIAADFRQAFQKVDVILTPTTPNEPFAIDEPPTDPIQMYLNDVFTVPSNLAGLPAISVPAGVSQNHLPLGLQLIGRRLEEGTLFRTAAVIEKAASFQTYRDQHLYTNGVWA